MQGLAGYGKDKELRKRIESICEESFKNHKYVICNDGEIALAGALNGKDGILVNFWDRINCIFDITRSHRTKWWMGIYVRR